MPPRQYPPAYLRYLRARLWNLARPGFWGTAIFLFVVGFVVNEYWLRPDILTPKQNTPVTTSKPAESSTLSDEDKAVVADIDNLPVLLNEFEKATLSATINPQEDAQEDNSESLFEDVIKKQNTASDAKSTPGQGIVNSPPPANEKNPFVVQAEKLLLSGTNDGDGQFLDVKSLNPSPAQTETTTFSSLEMGLTNKTKKNQKSVLISPLQAEINQLTQQNFSSLNNATSSQINPLAQTSSNEATRILPNNSLPSQSLPPSTGIGYIQPTVTNQPQNPYSNFNNGQTLPSVVTPTTGVSPITPAAPNNTTNSVQSSSRSITDSTTPVGYANYGNSGLQQPIYGNSSLQQPTNPSAIPGQYTGGYQR
ncbi:hypothetical protein Cylst_5732 [Cylindrospermum stagnale PCC 7417]|uniref:Uncharacterized protein n=1 Tax=Cylindrospermum stagnale PCC 7417 TaxID=56107 RepID=K9X5H8_9NOST|nr:hypothetical protein [Cylindrospermum stagnale]AFZ27728.1 hypothetical protein Cylst_5732 [Cylindrospermum stagnale PCC 7417]